jgi:hypothetical protein
MLICNEKFGRNPKSNKKRIEKELKKIEKKGNKISKRKGK